LHADLAIVLSGYNYSMLRLCQTSRSAIRDFIEKQSRLEMTYSAVGATASHPSAAYDVDRNRIRLGTGQAVFDASQAALQGWRQFHLGWVELYRSDTPIEPGQTVAVLARVCGL
jgi:uncharacterized protein (UPF0548 family)